MVNKQTTLSIITVVLNDLEGLKQTYNSIQSQLFSDFEWIVIDGGSSDGTKEFISNDKTLISSFISEPDNGIYDAMNKGIDKANAKWITFLNAGDSYTTKTSLSQIFLKKNDHLAFIYTDMFLLNENAKKVRYLKAEKLTKNSITKGMIACHQAMFVRLNLCPKYDNNLKYQGDLNWVMDILHSVDTHQIHYENVDSVYFKSGGFSDLTISKQLYEHLFLIIKRYGIFMLIIRIPRLIRRYLGKYVRKALGVDTFRFWDKKLQ